MNSHFPILSRAEVRDLDAAAISSLGISGMVLMENAARGVADVLRERFSDVGRILILSGPGNNGGDGLALTRQLAAQNHQSTTCLVSAGKPLTDDTQNNLDILKAAGINVEESDGSNHALRRLQELTRDDLIVDCLLGTGIRGAPRSPFSHIIEAINGSPAKVVSVDVPSGLNCDDGSSTGACVRANETVTFAGMKRGFQLAQAAPSLGHVTVAHIGLPNQWVQTWVRERRRTGVAYDDV